MSSLSGGVPPGMVEQLQSLMDFVKDPAYFDKIKEFQESEQAANSAKADAEAARADATDKLKELADEQASHAEAVASFEADKAEHAASVERWKKVMDAADKAIRGID